MSCTCSVGGRCGAEKGVLKKNEKIPSGQKTVLTIEVYMGGWWGHCWEPIPESISITLPPWELHQRQVHEV